MTACCKRAEALKPKEKDPPFHAEQAYIRAVERCRGLHHTESVLMEEIEERQRKLKEVRDEMGKG